MERAHFRDQSNGTNMIPKVLFEAAGDVLAPEIHALLAASKLPLDDVEVFLGDFIIARFNGELVGCIGLERYGKIALLRSLVVREDFRGFGIAKELCRRFEERLSGFEVVYLLTTTAADFFRKIGYEEINRDEAPPPIRTNKQFTTLCPSTAVLMKKILRLGGSRVTARCEASE